MPLTKGGSGAAPQPARRGGVVLELILAFPLLVILLLAVVEYGVLISNQQHLEMATRNGALAASGLDLPPSGPVPDEVLLSIGRELANAGIDLSSGLADGTIKVVLEHNVGSTLDSELNPSAFLTSGTLNCPLDPNPPAPDPDLVPYGRRYVRVTVCVRSDRLTPNLLRAFCLDLRQRVTAQTKTLRHTS